MTAIDGDYGTGNYHREKKYTAQRVIIKALFDGQWHRNMELKQKTKLSSRTLAKHLDEMVKAEVVERRVDNDSGKYPIPVLYKAKPVLLAYTKSSLLREEFSEKVETMLQETKDPLVILEVIHEYSQLGFLRLLGEIKSNRKISDEQIDFFEEVFLWSSYKSFMFDLVEATRKIIDTIDLNQLLESQVRRKIEASELLIGAKTKSKVP